MKNFWVIRPFDTKFLITQDGGNFRIWHRNALFEPDAILICNNYARIIYESLTITGTYSRPTRVSKQLIKPPMFNIKNVVKFRFSKYVLFWHENAFSTQTCISRFNFRYIMFLDTKMLFRKKMAFRDKNVFSTQEYNFNTKMFSWHKRYFFDIRMVFRH